MTYDNYSTTLVSSAGKERGYLEMAIGFVLMAIGVVVLLIYCRSNQPRSRIEI
jgi:hypothetical protein